MKLLWAVDVFENHPKAIRAMSRFLTALHAVVRLQVDAITVIFPADLSKSDPRRNQCRQLLNARLGGVRSQTWFNAAHVLFEPQVPQRVAVMDLIEYAQKENYDALVAVKHSKLGRKHAYLGSFAEMLAFLSPISLFLVSPDGCTPKKIQRVLLASDANLGCGRDFRTLSHFLPLKRLLVQIHHRIPRMFPWTAQDDDFYRKARTKTASRCLGQLQQVATEIGVATETTIADVKWSTVESILRAAQNKRSDLIVLTHKRRGAVGFLLGRITRRVLQRAERPVLLFRP